MPRCCRIWGVNLALAAPVAAPERAAVALSAIFLAAGSGRRRCSSSKAGATDAAIDALAHLRMRNCHGLANPRLQIARGNELSLSSFATQALLRLPRWYRPKLRSRWVSRATQRSCNLTASRTGSTAAKNAPTCACPGITSRVAPRASTSARTCGTIQSSEPT